VKPDFITYANGDPDGYALAVNINRRHLITEMARRLTGKNYNSVVSKRDASRGGNVGLEIRLSEASVVLDYAPDLIEKIFAGGMTLQQAAEIARPRKHEAAEIKKKMERLRTEAIDLYELVQDGRRHVDEAIAALEGMQERAKREADETLSNITDNIKRQVACGVLSVITSERFEGPRIKLVAVHSPTVRLHRAIVIASAGIDKSVPVGLIS
jgi:hypothetical protein